MDVTGEVEKIQAGPKGPQVGAFFDFDGTLIDGYSIAEYFKARVLKGQISSLELARMLRLPLTRPITETEFIALFRELITDWQAFSEIQVRQLWQRLFTARIAKRMFPEGYHLVRAHLQAGHTVAIASSATLYQVEPLAKEYGIEHILSTQLDVRRGVLSGKLRGEPLWGSRKAAAVERFARRRGVALSQSYGYANGSEDIDFLASVGRPTAVNPQPGMQVEAVHRNWPVLRFDLRGKVPLKVVASSVGCYSAMSATAVAGMAYNRIYNDPRRAVDLIASVGSDIGFALAGVKVRVINEHNLWRARPAVFIFNHQSKLDFFIACNLLRRATTGVIKKEVEKLPVVGSLLKMADMVFLDRGNSRQALAALRPVADTLKKGISVAITPEGTRSLTPKVGDFKKGAFHLARQAGVPVIPVVVRNSGELQWRGDQTIRPGTVDVCVHDPIDLSHWTDEQLDENVAEVRELFVQTLQNWPQPTQPRTSDTAWTSAN